MMRLRFFASSCGSAEMPSRSGISMSSTATSGLMRSIWLTASSPVRSELRPAYPAPRRSSARSCRGSRRSCRRPSPGAAHASSRPEPGHLSTQHSLLHQRHTAELQNWTPKATCRRIERENQIRPTSANFAVTMSLSNGFMMYSLAPACSARAMCATSFSVVQNTTLGMIAAGQAAQIAEEFVAVHDRHVPVEQDGCRHRALAGFERLFAVLGFDDLEVQAFQDAACDLADDA